MVRQEAYSTYTKEHHYIVAQEETIFTSQKINPNANLGDSSIYFNDEENELYEFPLDSEGFLSTQFNETAKIPTEFKIHSSSIKNMLYRAKKLEKWEHKTLNIPAIINGAYHTLKAILKNKLEQEYFSIDDISCFPYGYITKDGSPIGEIIHLFHSIKSLTQAHQRDYLTLFGLNKEVYPFITLKTFSDSYPENIHKKLDTIALMREVSPKERAWNLQVRNWGAQYYCNKQGMVSKAGILMAFVSLLWTEGIKICHMNNTHIPFMDNEIFNSTHAYYDILNNRLSFETYIQTAIQKNGHLAYDIVAALRLKKKGISNHELALLDYKYIHPDRVNTLRESTVIENFIVTDRLFNMGYEFDSESQKKYFDINKFLKKIFINTSKLNKHAADDRERLLHRAYHQFEIYGLPHNTLKALHKIFANDIQELQNIFTEN